MQMMALANAKSGKHVCCGEMVTRLLLDVIGMLMHCARKRNGSTMRQRVGTTAVKRLSQNENKVIERKTFPAS